MDDLAPVVEVRAGLIALLVVVRGELPVFDLVSQCVFQEFRFIDAGLPRNVFDLYRNLARGRDGDFKLFARHVRLLLLSVRRADLPLLVERTYPHLETESLIVPSSATFCSSIL